MSWGRGIISIFGAVARVFTAPFKAVLGCVAFVYYLASRFDPSTIYCRWIFGSRPKKTRAQVQEELLLTLMVRANDLLENVGGPCISHLLLLTWTGNPLIFKPKTISRLSCADLLSRDSNATSAMLLTDQTQAPLFPKTRKPSRPRRINVHTLTEMSLISKNMVIVY